MPDIAPSPPVESLKMSHHGNRQSARNRRKYQSRTSYPMDIIIIFRFQDVMEEQLMSY